MARPRLIAVRRGISQPDRQERCPQLHARFSTAIEPVKIVRRNSARRLGLILAGFGWHQPSLQGHVQILVDVRQIACLEVVTSRTEERRKRHIPHEQDTFQPGIRSTQGSHSFAHGGEWQIIQPGNHRQGNRESTSFACRPCIFLQLAGEQRIQSLVDKYRCPRGRLGRIHNAPRRCRVGLRPRDHPMDRLIRQQAGPTAGLLSRRRRCCLFVSFRKPCRWQDLELQRMSALIVEVREQCLLVHPGHCGIGPSIVRGILDVAEVLPRLALVAGNRGRERIAIAVLGVGRARVMVPDRQQIAGRGDPRDRYGRRRSHQRRRNRFAPCRTAIRRKTLVLSSQPGTRQHQNAAIFQLDAGWLPRSVTGLDPL